MSEAPTSEISTPIATDYVPARAGNLAQWRIVAPVGLSVFLTMLPVTMLVPVLKEIVADRFAVSTFWTHSFMSINLVGAVVAALLAGIFADRLGRRKPLLLAAILADGLLLWGMGMTSRFPVFMLLRFFEGMAHILALTSLMAMASDWAGPNRRGRMMGVVGACLIFGTTVGAPLGGTIGRTAPHLVFPIGALIAFAMGLVVILSVRECGARRRGTTIHQIREMFARHRALSVPYLYAFIDRFCVGVVITTFVLYLRNVLSLAPHQIGMMMACFMLPFAALCYPAGRLIDRVGRIWPMAVGSIAFGLVFATYGLWSPQQLVAIMVLSGVLSAVMFAPNLALCADLAPKGGSTTAFAGFNIAGSLGFLCGPLVAGVLCMILLPLLGDENGYRMVLAVSGGTEVVCALATLPLLLRLRRAGATR